MTTSTIAGLHETILGSSLSPIETATTELVRRGLKVEQYKIELIQQNDSIVVIFSDPIPAPEGMRGSPGKIPAFEVVLAADGQTILNSHFVR